VTKRTIVTWLGWVSIMAIATIVMFQVRATIDQVHVVLIYLLIVLGASATSGRVLAISLACSGYLLIDYYFQRPYGSLINDKPVDLMALAAFLVTAIVAANLLVRAQTQADEAQRRAVEISSLARLGSETLSIGRAEDALARIATVIGSTLGMEDCSIVAWNPQTGFGASARSAASSQPAIADPLTRTVVEQAGWTWVRPSGSMVRVVPGDSRDRPPAPEDEIQKLLIPLSVQNRVVGVLRLEALTPVKLTAAQRRFLEAITFYAALAVDRVRLVAEAEHAEALREADRLKDIVLASVSHDLRTPLTTIKALAQSEAMQGNKSAAAIEEQADRLTRLVSDLLDLSRLKGGGFAVTPELNTAEDLIGAAVRQTRGLFAERPLRTVIDLNSPALVGRFDFSQSLRVLCNLLENAVRYSHGKPVELSAGRDGDLLVFSVSDRGPGVRDEDRTRIFEPFFRASNSAPDTGRAGLGLSIARTLAEMQGGSVRYAAREGGGSTFSLQLPATELHADALEQNSEANG
jgi:two-component system, OmpR family, sensor histidine kinase KdpD